MTVHRSLLQNSLQTLIEECVEEVYGYDDDDTPLVVREEDPYIEEKLDRMFGKLPPHELEADL